MSPIRLIASTLLVSILTACGGGGGGGSSASTSNSTNSQFSTTNSSCNSFTLVEAGNYGTNPDIWGISATNLTNSQYSVCTNNITSSGNTMSGVLSWNFGSWTNSYAVAAYPDVYYGAVPGFPVTTNSQLPKQISQLNSLNVSWNYTLTHGTGDDANLLIDSWLTTTPNATGWDQQHGMAVEFLIYLDQWGVSASTAYTTAPIVTINGVQFYYYGWNGSNTNWTSTYDSNNVFRAYFYPVNNLGTNYTLDLKPFMTYLTTNNIIPNNLYFSTVEFGNEVYQGTGQTTINSFSVVVQ